MNFRYTIKELKEKSDYEMLRCIVVERKSTCTNVNSPLHKRLEQLHGKLDERRLLTQHFDGEA